MQPRNAYAATLALDINSATMHVPSASTIRYRSDPTALMPSA